MPARPLPENVFEEALHLHMEMQERRIRRMYNRARAVFAESVVASLLPDAEVVEDPSAAWDVVWSTRGRGRLRIEVKCSGEMLPRFPGRLTKPKWSFPAPSSGWDPDLKVALPAGRHCDVFVLARHSGENIEVGWEFFVLTAAMATRDRNVSQSHLEAMGAIRCDPAHLGTTIRRVAAPVRKRR